MKGIRTILTRTAWWAPVAVLALHQLVRIYGLRSRTDALMHFSGGLAITWFLWSLLPFLECHLGRLTSMGRVVVAGLAGLSVALIWELAEFASDLFLGTTIQKTIRETMLDLSWSSGGVLLILIFFCFGGNRRNERAQRGQP